MTHTHPFDNSFKVLDGFLMCLSSSQEIQPGYHNEALLGRKVSVCAWKWVYGVQHGQFSLRCLGYLTMNRLQIKTFDTELDMAGIGILENPQANKQGGNTQHTYRFKCGRVLSPSCFTSYPSSAFLSNCHICFFCHNEVFCSQNALVTLSLQVRTKWGKSYLGLTTLFFWFSVYFVNILGPRSSTFNLSWSSQTIVEVWSLHTRWICRTATQPPV